MNTTIASAGTPKGDPYHNEFIDTASLLASGLVKSLSDSGSKTVSEASSKASVVKDSETTIANKIKIKHQDAILNKINDRISELKAILIGFFKTVSGSESMSVEVHRMIKKVELLQKELDVTFEAFDPLKNMSGLKTMGHLENAERVIANTVNHYKLYGISSIRSFMSDAGPVIEINIFGDNGENGFETTGNIVAKNDFNGNEAIDYVYSHEGGLMTVKARVAGNWQTVSEDYIVDCKVKKYKLGSSEEGMHSVFLGEKIISEGKENLIKVLKINSENIKFGKCRVFSKDKQIIQSIASLVRINKHET